MKLTWGFLITVLIVSGSVAVQNGQELILVKFKQWPPQTEQLERVRVLGLREYKRIPEMQIVQFRPLGAMPPEKIVAKLKTFPFVAYAEPQRIQALAGTEAGGGEPRPPQEEPAVLKAPPTPQVIPGRLLVKMKPGIEAAAMAQRLQDIGLRVDKTIPQLGLEICTILGEQTIEQAIERCQAIPEVEYAEPDYRVFALEVPNDPDFSRLWGLNNTGQTGGKADADIDAPEAWDVQKGRAEIVVGVVDTGIEYDHPDLKANMWHNPGEVPANGQDDDHNGFVDDVFGWDFLHEDADPRDDNRHGTHVSGTIGAVGNNGRGVVGVNWTVRLMALKFLSAQGSGATSDAIEAIVYGATNGANILNNSWGGGGDSRALKDAIAFARDRGVLFVAAAGNEGKDNDVSPNYPSNYDLENMLAVASSNSSDQLSGFSNFGRHSVDLAAPGENIYSTTRGHSYETLSGTSMATPHVSGAAALVWAQFYPDIDWQGVWFRLAGAVDPVPEFASKMVFGGRLNVARALASQPLIALVERPAETVAPGDSLILLAGVVGSSPIATVTVVLQYAGSQTGLDSIPAHSVDRYRYRAVLPPLKSGTTLRYQIKALDQANLVGVSRVFETKTTSQPGGGGCASAGAFGQLTFNLPGVVGQTIAAVLPYSLFWIGLVLGWHLLVRTGVTAPGNRKSA